MDDLIAAAFRDLDLPKDHRDTFFAGAALVFDALENARVDPSVSLGEYVGLIDSFRRELGHL